MNVDRHREWVLAYALRGDDGADHAFKRHVRIDLCSSFTMDTQSPTEIRFVD